MSPDERAVWTRLMVGQRNARTKADLAAASGLPTRTVEACIESLRQQHVAIDSGSAGYWLPTSAATYAAGVQARRRRAVKQLVNNRHERAAMRALQVAEDKREGLSLWEGRV